VEPTVLTECNKVQEWSVREESEVIKYNNTTATILMPYVLLTSKYFSRPPKKTQNFSLRKIPLIKKHIASLSSLGDPS